MHIERLSIHLGSLFLWMLNQPNLHSWDSVEDPKKLTRKKIHNLGKENITQSREVAKKKAQRLSALATLREYATKKNT